MTITDFPNVQSWSIATSTNISPFATSDTSGSKSRVTQVSDWSATVNILAASSFIVGIGGGDVLLGTGDEKVVTFWEDGVVFWTGTAICEGIETNLPVEDGAPVSQTITFGGSGVLTSPAGSQNPFSSKDGDATWGSA